MEEGIAYSGDRWLKMLVVCLAIAACYINVQAYAPILGEIAKGLQVDVGKAGQLFTAVALAAATGLVLGGFVCDRFGITFMLASGLLMTSLTAVLMPWMGHSFTLVFICRLIQGIGTAFVFVTVAPILSSWFPPREHGLTGGLMVGCLSLGSAIGGFVAGPLLAASGTWQKSVAILSIPGWLGIILALWIVGKSPAQRAVSQSLKTGDPNGPTFGKALASSTTWIGILIVLFNASALVNLMAQVQPYLALEAPLGLGLGPVTAGQLALPLFLMGIPAPIVGGIFFEKVAKAKARPAIIIGFFLIAVTYLILVPMVYNNFILLMICLMLAGWGVVFMTPSITAFIAMHYPSNLVGSVSGLWFGLGSYGGAAALYIGGLTVSRFGVYNIAISMITAFALLGLLVTFFLKPPRL